MADIQINATGGDVPEQTFIQIRRGSTATDSPPVEDDVEQFSAHEREELTETGISREGRPIVPSSGYEDPLHYEDPVMHISGTGHWFLEGWIGDHSVEFLVDSGSSVTSMSDIFYRNLVHAGAPVGALQITARTLRSANGTGIEVLGCSRCSVSFLGLRTEFPIIVCSLAAGTDAIIGTDVLGSVLPHTLDIKNGLLFARGGASLQLHRRDSALSGRVFTVGHSSIPPYSEAVLHCSVQTTGGRALPSSGLLEGLTLFAEETGLIVGRTVVDPSGWKVPVLVSNFSQETVVVSPFTEVGMIAQVTAIQSVTDDRIQRRGVTGELPHHLRGPFGLCNAPATFERLMDRVLQGLRWSRCLVYLDDIISFGGTFSAALSNLTLIFERLRSYGLQLKSSKCHLFRASVPFLGHIVGRRGLECDPKKIEDVKSWPVPDCLKSVRQFLGFVGYYRRFIPKFADIETPMVYLTGKDVPFVWDTSCSAAFQELRASLIDAPILAFPTETGQYILDTDASNFGLGGVLSQMQNDQERVVAYCSRALRPSQRRYCTTKREMLAVVAMCIQFRSYLRGARFTLRTDHKSLVWLHRFKDTEGMLSRWLHSLQQFQFSIIDRPGKDHGNADGLSRAPSSPCRQCTRPDCPPATLIHHDSDQPFDCVSTGSSEDADLVPVQSGEDWIARLDDDLSRPVETSGDSFRISAPQKEDPVCVALHDWVVADDFPTWAEVKSMLPELWSLWHRRNNLSVDDNGTLWRKRSSQSAQLQLLVPKAGRERLFLSYHASLFGGHLGRTRTLGAVGRSFLLDGYGG